MTRRVREGTLTASAEAIFSNQILFSVEKEYLVVPLDKLIVASAQPLIRRHALRALDSIQLASAIRGVTLLTEPMTFISSDNKLLNAALAEGFLIDNPSLHP